MILWLIGMMGSGKTAAGRLAAARLGVPFYDTDQVVSERAGRSVAEVWESLGEAVFRELEKAAMASLSGQEGVVATGGGVVLDEGNRRTLTESGKVIWLEASPAVLASRLVETGERPLLQGGDRPTEVVLSEHLAKRAPLYAAVATHRIHTDDLDVEEVAVRIEEIWRR